MSLPSYYVDVSGVETRYVQLGSGRPLLLLHGGDFRSPSHSIDWDLNISDLASRGYRVIALDKLGQGGTAGPTSLAGYTMRSVYEHVECFIDALGLTGNGATADLTLVGHSRGGLPAATYALNHPEVVRSLVIVSSATCAPEVPSDNAAFYAKAFQGMSDTP